MDMKTISWAAGIYEGEGHFATSSGTNYHVHVVQKDSWLPYRLRNLFGGSVYQYNGYHKWMLCGDKARGFLLTIFSFLSPRRKAQILEGKGFFIRQTCKNGLHDYATSMSTETTSRGKVMYCWRCRIEKKVRNSAVRRRKRMLDNVGKS